MMEKKPGQKITDITALEEGDIVRHTARKTLRFVVTGFRGHSALISRCDEAGNPDNRYKGYRVGPKDVMRGALTYVDSRGEVLENKRADLKMEARITDDTHTLNVARLEQQDFLGEYYHITCEFRKLETQLSPENLTCDGELSPNQIAARKKDIMNKWRLLEMYINKKVTPEV